MLTFIGPNKKNIKDIMKAKVREGLAHSLIIIGMIGFVASGFTKAWWLLYPLFGWVLLEIIEINKKL